MTTSKILVPAGTNLDGTKDRVPVDIEIPQPLHVVIDGSGGGDSDLASYLFDITPMLNYLATSGGELGDFSFFSTDDLATGNPTSGLICTNPDNAQVLLMAGVGHHVGCSIVLRNLSSDPSSSFGSFEVEDSSDQRIIGGPITWNGGSSGRWSGMFSFELSEDFTPVSQDEYVAYGVYIVQSGH